MPRQYWLIKSEPNTYPFDKLVSDGRTTWDGVRNFTARNNLRAMKEGDLAFFYHSNIGKEIVGAAKVCARPIRIQRPKAKTGRSSTSPPRSR